MIKGFWAILPLLLVMSLDSACTLLGQPAAYWQGSYASIHEGHPLLAWLLGQGPKGFLLGMAAAAGITVVLVAVLPGMLGQTLYAVAALWHGLRVCGRLDVEATRLLTALGGHLSGSLREASLSLAVRPGSGPCASFAMVVLVSGVTVVCWRWAGLLPMAKAKPAKDGGKPAKKKEKD